MRPPQREDWNRALDNDEEVRHFREMPVLRALGDEVLEKLAHIAQEEVYASDEAVFEEGAEGDSMCFIIEGVVVIQKRLDDASDRWKDVAVSEAGDIIGEMALFDKKPRSATVRARGPVRVLTIYRRDFEKFLLEDSASASAILGGLLSMQNQRLREALAQNVTMFELVNIIATVQDVRELGHQVIERLVASISHCDAGAFCYWSPYVDECEVLAVKGAPVDEASVLSISREGPVANMLAEKRGEPFVIGPFDADHPVRRLFGVKNADTLLVTALTHAGTLLGFVLLVGRDQPFSSAQRLLVAAVAAPVASAIVNARYASDEQARGRLAAAKAARSMPR